MTDNASDTLPDAFPDVARENCNSESAVRSPETIMDFPNGTGASVGAESSGDVPGCLESNPVDNVEDGVTLHIVPSHDPGTIFVAVAEPADFAGDLPFSAIPYVCPHPEVEGSAPEPAETMSPPPLVSCKNSLPDYAGLVEIAAVRVNGLGPALFFTVSDVACKSGDKVIVAMEDGQAYGVVLNCMRGDPAHLEDAGEGGGIRPLLRHATDKDILTAGNNAALAAEALEYCRNCIRGRNLDMKLVDVLVLHDRSKMFFYFTAPARIDFRELVKDLVCRYRTRIELRQIGVRHETQMIGALGNCGMVCCCRRYLRKFAPVAIKMAKEQNVFLNPVKISGICGRLLCCLAYEQEHYDEFYRSCPKLGKKYQTDTGVVRVLRASLFRESVTVLTENGEEKEFSLAEWSALHPFRPNASQPQGGRKQETQSRDARQRKNEGKDRGPVSGFGREQDLSAGKDQARDRSRRNACDVAQEFEPDAEWDVTRPEKYAAAAYEEPSAFSARIVLGEESGVAPRLERVSAAQNQTEKTVHILEKNSANPKIWSAENGEFEDGDADGAEESIFGLAPGWQAPPSGQEPAREKPRRENAHSRRSSRRRKPRSGPST